MDDVVLTRKRINALRAELLGEWQKTVFDHSKVEKINSGLLELIDAGRAFSGKKMAFEGLDDELSAPVVSGSSKDDLRKMLAEAITSTQPRADEDRRFTNKPDLDPSAVRSLPPQHPALVNNRTLFPNTVINVDENFSGRLLISGKNSRKLGERITKGAFKGYALYQLSLEERATCPTDCEARTYCYGNGMHLAKRHRIISKETFFNVLENEIGFLLAQHPDGLMVRLHVLGDFPDVEYVAFWADMLSQYEKLACYGYTHRLPVGAGGDEIGNAIEALKSSYKDRFRIRWSWAKSLPDGAVIIDRIPVGPRVSEGLVCPAQTDATACCASCGLCWEANTRHQTIVFVKHGPKSMDAAAIATVGEKPPIVNHVSDIENVRSVAIIAVPKKLAAVFSAPPKMRNASPLDLKIEAKYQRDLSGKSIRLIRKIVAEWNWAKFKPPICADQDGCLMVLDGQHTAIAAASHPDIVEIPVMIVSDLTMERRAEAFVSHNRDRLIMTPAQILYGDAAAGRADALGVLNSVTNAGGVVPRLPVGKAYAKRGEITAISELRSIYSAHGAELTERCVRIAVLSDIAPISKTVLGAIRYLLTEKPTSDLVDRPDRQIAAALASIDNLEATAQAHALETGQGRVRAAAVLLAQHLRERTP